LSIEWKRTIRDFLNDHNEKQLRQYLRENWLEIYPEEKEEIYNFLFHAQLIKLFFYLLSIDLQNQNLEIPWDKTLFLLNEHKTTLPKEFFSELVKQFQKHKKMDASPDNLPLLLSALRQRERQIFMEKIQKRKKELLESARIAQSEQLMDQHLHYMNELKKIFPLEYKVSHLVSKQEKKRAERIISKSAQKNITRSKPRFSDDEEKKVLDQLTPQAEKLLGNKKIDPADLAYLFRTMDQHRMAIDFVQESHELDKKDWRLLDYLLTGQQYIALLQHCQDLKTKYNNEPDALFAISYSESIAYWELGEKQKAFTLMDQIAAMRPHFKSANEILSQWKEEGFE
jgi:hypothetical protein